MVGYVRTLGTGTINHRFTCPPVDLLDCGVYGCSLVLRVLAVCSACLPVCLLDVFCVLIKRVCLFAGFSVSSAVRLCVCASFLVA